MELQLISELDACISILGSIIAMIGDDREDFKSCINGEVCCTYCNASDKLTEELQYMRYVISWLQSEAATRMLTK